MATIKSIEEKAKAYDEALEMAKNTLELAKVSVDVKGCLESIFPELKESEDERIKKLLVEAVIQVLQDQFCSNRGVSKEKVVAWIEKQGEQKSYAWNEEDEVKINRIVACLENLNVADNDILIKDVDWLKSLKDRVLPQPKQEWNEEDKNRFNNLIFLIECSDENEPTKKGFIDFINKLKSTIHQRHWKPSKEQMAVLNEVINFAADSEFQHWNNFIYTILSSLRDQLRKLRE